MYRTPLGRWDQADDMEKATHDTTASIHITKKKPSLSLHFSGPLDHAPAGDNFPEVIHIKDYVALALGSFAPPNDPFGPPPQPIPCIVWFLSSLSVFTILMVVFYFNLTYSQQEGSLVAVRRAWAAFKITICVDLVVVGRGYWRVHRKKKAQADSGCATMSDQTNMPMKWSVPSKR